MTRRLIVAALALAACGDRRAGGTVDGACASFAPPPTGVTVDAAREAHRRSALRQRLRDRDALDPGYTLRATAASADQAAIDRGEVCTGELYETGRLLFEHAYTHAEGLGEPFRRVQLARRGGPETTSCTSCHWRGGVAGAGSYADDAYFVGDHDRVSSGEARNPPSLVGSGAVQALAQEMSAELAAQRAAAIAKAAADHAAVTVTLTTKGVEFGTLHVEATGKVSTRDVHGVDPDLVVRPFGWKGTAATINEFVAESAALHLGIESDDVLARPRHGDDPIDLGSGGAGDPDGDGVVHELSAGQLTALSVYIATLELPISRPPDEPIDRAHLAGATRPYLVDEWTRGRALFASVGCADCHVPSLVLARAVATITSPVTGGTIEVDLARDTEAPRLAYDAAHHGYPVYLFSDLKRHDLGPENATLHVQGGISPRLFLTRRLWGLADSAPYFHDGASSTIDRAVARHGGEGAFARDNWNTLSDHDRNALRTFLTALRREPRLQVP